MRRCLLQSCLRLRRETPSPRPPLWWSSSHLLQGSSSCMDHHHLYPSKRHLSSSSSTTSSNQRMSVRERNKLGFEDSYLHQVAKDLPTQRENVERMLSETYYPVGSFSPETWFEAEELLRWWGIQRTVESVHYSFRLLDRLYQENAAHPYHFLSWLNDKSESVFNRIINNWRVVWWDHHEELGEDLSPRKVYQKVVEEYNAKHGTMLNEKTFYLLAEAELTVPSNKEASASEFVQIVLQKSLELYQSGVEECLPSTEFCNLLLSAYIKEHEANDTPISMEVAQDADAFLKLVLDFKIPYSPRTYQFIIHIWALTANVKGAVRAQEWLSQMYSDFLNGDAQAQPDGSVFASVISAWTRTGLLKEATERAERILEQMREIKEQGALVDDYTETSAYNAAIVCFGNQKTRAAAQRAQQLFDKYLTLPSKADYVSYLNLMTAWANAGDPVKANDVFTALKRKRKESDLLFVEPDELMYTTLIAAWAKSDHPDKVLRGLELIKEMENQNLRPTVIAYNALLGCFSKTKTHDGLRDVGKRAEEILNEMKERADAGEEAIRPNAVTYATVMSVWANFRHAERAARLLDRMIAEYEAGFEDCKPDIYVFNTVLAAYSKSKKCDPVKVLELLRRMQELAADGNIEFSPDVVSYSTVIAALSKAKDKKYVEQAPEVFQEMRKAYLDGDTNLKPNVQTYNALMNCFAEMKRPDLAEELLRDMNWDYQENGNRSARPSRATYHTLMKAWAISGHKASCSRVETILRRMIEMGKDDESLQPDIVTYTTAMKCYETNVRSDPGVAPKAIAMYRHIEDRFKKGLLKEGPNRFTLRALLKTIRDSQMPDKEELLQWVDDERKRHYLSKK